MPRRFTFAAALASLAILLGGVVTAADDKNSAESLPKDSTNIYGQYENGVKYIIRKNANPPGRVSVWLHIRTGSSTRPNSRRAWLTSWSTWRLTARRTLSRAR